MCSCAFKLSLFSITICSITITIEVSVDKKIVGGAVRMCSCAFKLSLFSITICSITITIEVSVDKKIVGGAVRENTKHRLLLFSYGHFICRYLQI